MTTTPSNRVTVELTSDEARLVLAAVKQFEPYWPSDLDDLSRAELLVGIRSALEHVRSTIGEAVTTGS
jgi:hypothetical protein